MYPLSSALLAINRIVTKTDVPFLADVMVEINRGSTPKFERLVTVWFGADTVAYALHACPSSFVVNAATLEVYYQ